MKNGLSIGRIGKLLLIISLPTLLFIYGCGGGGGGGGSAGSGITYSGSLSQATIDGNNAETIATGTYTGGQIGSVVGGFGAVRETGIDRPRYLQLTQAIEEAIRQIDVHAPPGVVVSGAVSEFNDSIPGSCGGSASFSIQINDSTGAFSGNISFNNFCSEGTTINGTASFSGIVDINHEISQFTLTFTSLTGTIGADSFTLDGTITLYLSSTSFTAMMDMRQRDNNTGKVYWVNNFEMTASVISGNLEFSVSGRFYDPDYGYVVVETTTPFRINSGQSWPSQGVMICTGNNNTKARLMVNPPPPTPTTFVVEADTDGNGSYDWTSGNLSWQ